MTDQPYQFSTALFGHTSDVRCVSVTHDGRIISGSRDMSARLWKREAEDTRNYSEALAFTCHGNFVSSVCFLMPNSQFPNGVIITGSLDKKIRLFDPTITAPFMVLQDHTNTVCKVTSAKVGYTFLSSSWDMTARAWKVENSEWQSISLTGHTAAVWSVCQLGSGPIVTASADKMLQVFNESGVFQAQLKGHTDCVRDVVALGPYEVLSVANDATVRCWNVQTLTCTHTFSNHQHYIYSIAILDGVGWVTSSEDKTVKIWNFEGELQSLTLPGESVWGVAVLPNSDIVTGSDDGIVRVFSRDPKRIADPQSLAIYEETIAQSMAKVSQTQQTQSVKISELPERDALNTPGKSDGQSKVIRVGNKAIAFTWSGAKGTWEEVGEVMGYGQSDRMHNGKEYDYVFSVDIEDGKPPLKLPYNKSDDPWVAANQFLQENLLPLSYLEQVANFIINCIGKSAQPAESNSGFVDPFTGASRYVPTSNGSTSFGGSASNLSPPTTTPKPVQYFPQRNFLRFDQSNISAIKDKILQLNKIHNLGVSEDAVARLLGKCESSASCSSEDLELLDHLLRWDSTYVFPILDTIRLLIRQPSTCDSICKELIPKLQEHLGVHPNNMLIFRIFSNMMSTPAGENCALKNIHYLLTLISSEPKTYTKPVEIGMATLILNIAVLLQRHGLKDHRQEALKVCRDILSEFNDEEAVFRALVALGTLLTDMPNRSETLTPFRDVLHKFSTYSAKRISECAKRIIL